MGLRMNGETELTFKQLRELALAHHVKDSKTVIGIWAIPRDASRKITRFTPFTSR
jgi:hypothetical protein